MNRTHCGRWWRKEGNDSNVRRLQNRDRQKNNYNSNMLRTRYPCNLLAGSDSPRRKPAFLLLGIRTGWLGNGYRVRKGGFERHTTRGGDGDNGGNGGNDREGGVALRS